MRIEGGTNMCGDENGIKKYIFFFSLEKNVGGLGSDCFYEYIVNIDFSIFSFYEGKIEFRQSTKLYEQEMDVKEKV